MTLTSKIIIVLLSGLIIGTAGQNAECKPVDLVFVVAFPTTSNDWGYVKTVMTDIVRSEHFPEQITKIAVVTVSSTAKVEFLLDRYHRKNDIVSAINGIQWTTTRSTDLLGALRLVREQVFLQSNGNNPVNRNTVVLVTDARFQFTDALRSEANRLRQLRVQVKAIGVTKEVTMTMLSQLAFYDFDILSVNNYRQLLERQKSIFTLACTPSEDLCYNQMDLVLILDQSTSIIVETDDNWYVHLLGFAKNVVEKFKIGRDYTRVAVVKFSDSAEVPIYFDSYFDTKILTDAIGSLKINGGSTNIYGALRKTRTEVYRAARGYRENVAHIIVLITDGMDNKEAEKLSNEIRLLKEFGVSLFVIGITNKVDTEQLREIASEPHYNHVLQVNQFTDLDYIVNYIFPYCR